jgi:sulfopyruvate decarboxylase TPP-binding subunit
VTNTVEKSHQLVDVTMELVREYGFTHLVSVANYETEALRKEFEKDPDLNYLLACREGEAVAIASGLIASGHRTILCMENLGLFESLDTFRGIPCDMKIPLPVFVGYAGRGATLEGAFEAVGGMAGHVKLAGDWTEPILDATSIKHGLLLQDDSEEATRKTLTAAFDAQEPFVVLVDNLDRVTS